MAVGLRIPVGVGTGGGARLVGGEENDRKIIFLSLGSGWNENAFQQDIALGQAMIFATNDPSVRALIRRRLIAIFREFQALNRYRLLQETIKWSEDAGRQELVLEFKYANLETDEVKDFTQRFTAAGPRRG